MGATRALVGRDPQVRSGPREVGKVGRRARVVTPSVPGNHGLRRHGRASRHGVGDAGGA